MANSIIVDGQTQYVMKTSQLWSSSAAAYQIIPTGVLCIEKTPSGKILLKIGDNNKIYSKLPYLSCDTDISNYYTKTETDAAITNAITALGYMLRIKGTVASTSALPTSNNEIGDLYFVDDVTSQTDPNVHYVRACVWIKEQKWYMFDGRGSGGTGDYVTKEEFNEFKEDVEEDIAELMTSKHIHLNKDILDQTTAPYTIEEQEIVSELNEYGVRDFDKMKIYVDDVPIDNS